MIVHPLSITTPQPLRIRAIRSVPIVGAIVVILLTGPLATRAAALKPSGGAAGAKGHTAGQPVARKRKLPPSAKPAPPIWPQGYFLHNARGWIRIYKNRSYPRLVFAHPLKGWNKFIRLLPNLTLAALVKPHEHKFPLLQVSGEVTAYKGKNYLLLDANVTFPARHAPVSPAKSPAHTQRPARTAHEFSRRTPPNPKNLIQNLLGHRISRPVGLTAAPPAPAVQPPLPTPTAYRGHQWTALPEGTYVWNQRGRLLRNPVTHQWLLVFASDGRGTGRPPIILLPCRRLAIMETENNGPDGGKPFIVSGQITEYHRHNFLLITAAQRFYMLHRF